MKPSDSITINGYKHVKYQSDKISTEETLKNSESYYQWLDRRRSVREFSTEFIPQETIANILKSASTAPSGAHRQPWTFYAVSNPEVKSKIRVAAEVEEKKNY